jgi:outer membrane protein OmpA-like peptidoglycan-associated protein
MESPFTNFTGTGENHNDDPIHYEGTLLKSPFTDLTYESDTLVSEEVHKIGNATLTVAEPSPAGNPLLVVKPGDRNLPVTTHFTVGEYARAQSGKYKFDFVRIDPALADNLQRLRNFLGRPVTIIDGYYTLKYLKEVLGIKDDRRISLNPHISGRAVKIRVDGYKRMIKQLAIAAIVTCDRDINLGIGESTMTLYVKQPLSKPLDILPEDYQRIVSYISDEKVKVAASKFCVDVKRILFTYPNVYEKAMNKAVSAFAVIMLKIYYKQDTIPNEWMEWEKPLAVVVALMASKSETKDPDMILYCIAYSAFGNLYRNFLKSKEIRQSIDFLINDLTTANDRTTKNSPGTFLALQTESDKTRFIDFCRQRIMLGMRSDDSRYHLAPVSFFDWKDHPQDKIFKDKLSEFMKKVYLGNQNLQGIPAQQSPVGGTRRSMEESPADPDKPVIDFTGRYVAVYPPGNQDLHGKFVDINQAGYYISGKMGDIPVKDERKTVTEFYGKVDDKGNGICPLYPQQTLLIKKIHDRIWLFLFNNPPKDPFLQLPLVPVSKRPVISNLMLKTFGRLGKTNQELLLIMAWISPLPDHLKASLESFRKNVKDVKEAITGYYNVNATRPSLKEDGLHKNISALDTAIDYYMKLPPMFLPFAKYYNKLLYSVSPHWSPRDDRPASSLLDWIKKMLEEYRDFTETDKVVKLHKRLYDYFDVETKKSDDLFEYDVKIKLTAFGVGPFARSSGTITLINKTDPAKYPSDKKWTQKEYPIVVWNATLSLNPFKLLPKISTGQTIEASSGKTVYYRDTDFSGADIEITEGKLLEIPVSGDSGGIKASTKAGIGGLVILIDTQGQKTLSLKQDLSFSLPDTIEFEPSDSSEKEGLYEKIAGFLPSLTLYKGSIDTEKTSKDIKGVPLPDRFTASYQLKDTRFFMHDNPVLTAQAIEAIGRLCAEELVAFSDPVSEIEIYGHADASGDPKHNLELSLMRAVNVRTAIEDRLGFRLKAKFNKVEGLGESVANKVFGEFTEKNAWLRRVVVIINGRAVLSLGE